MVSYIGEVRLPVHLPKNVGVLNVVGQGIDKGIVLVIREPHALLFAHRTGSEIIFIIFHLVKILLILRHLFQLPLALIFVDFIGQFPIFPILLFFALLLLLVHGLQPPSLLDLVHELAPVHVFHVGLSFPLLQLPLPGPLLALLDRNGDVLVLHAVPDGEGADVGGLQLLLVAQEHVVVLDKGTVTFL